MTNRKIRQSDFVLVYVYVNVYGYVYVYGYVSCMGVGFGGNWWGGNGSLRMGVGVMVDGNGRGWVDGWGASFWARVVVWVCETGL